MRLDRTLSKEEIEEAHYASEDYQVKEWEVQGQYPEWHPCQGNYQGQGEVARKTLKRDRPHFMAPYSQEKGKG
jgi:hypothetical protein